ncbi:hypothetical protein PIB30_091734 [Stylosanthes scabra]|uniref:Uncharacterized protein n=1 Tax=Stylosanthes scabra TaxID=79078 RepID=A0ABU6ZTA8_9FABA|nr:hypothetical protein [Stylosanthes scabra]
MKYRFFRTGLGPISNFWRRCRGTEKLASISIPDLLLFDPEIKRTVRHARQVRHQLEFESNLHSQTQNLASANNSGYSSDPDFDLELSTSFSDSGTSTMGDIPRLTLK